MKKKIYVVDNEHKGFWVDAETLDPIEGNHYGHKIVRTMSHVEWERKRDELHIQQLAHTI